MLNGKNSELVDILLGVPQGSVLGPLFFIVYINNIVENIGCEIKLFADDTSLFSIVYNEAKTAEELDRDWQWKMKFNT